MKRRKYLLIIPVLLIAALPFGIMFLWNNIVVPIFAIKAITYLQALGLFILSRILFGGFHFGKHHRPPFADKSFRESWLGMSAEEREHFKEEWKKRKTGC